MFTVLRRGNTTLANSWAPHTLPSLPAASIISGVGFKSIILIQWGIYGTRQVAALFYTQVESVPDMRGLLWVEKIIVFFLFGTEKYLRQIWIHMTLSYSFLVINHLF